MPLLDYSYNAVDQAGDQQTGTIKADSREAVESELKQRGLIVVGVKEHRAPLAAMNIRIGKKIKASELTLLTRQLSTMISSGMTLLRACYVLEEQLENKALKDTISSVRDSIESGNQFSEALANHPKVFSPLFIAMVRAGEAGGVLEQSLQRVADQLEKDDSLRRQVRAAMVYPAVVLSFALIVLTALLLFIVPVFVKVFKQFNSKIPAMTQAIMDASRFMSHDWYIIFGVLIAIIVGFRYWRRSRTGRPQWDALRLRVPLKIGQTVQKVALARWSRSLAALYSAGVPIMQAIEVTGQTAGNAVVEKAMQDVITSVKSGGTISGPLREAAVFPNMVSQMVAVGEESGNLDAMLSKIADFYEDEVAAAVKMLTSVLEPVMILVVGGIVGVIVIAMYLPMFSVYNAIK